MSFFSIDPLTITDLTASLRRDAEDLSPLQVPDIPATGLTAQFSAALAHAVAAADMRAAQLRQEALRLADAMELTLNATVAVDETLARSLTGVAP